jgi:hypothetical protein
LKAPTPESVVDHLAAEHESQADADLLDLMKHPRFRRWWFRLIDDPRYCHLEGPVKADSERESMWLEGRRSIAMQLKLDIYRVAPELFVRGLSEALEQRDQDRELIAEQAAKAATENQS